MSGTALAAAEKHGIVAENERACGRAQKQASRHSRTPVLNLSAAASAVPPVGGGAK